MKFGRKLKKKGTLALQHLLEKDDTDTTKGEKSLHEQALCYDLYMMYFV